MKRVILFILLLSQILISFNGCALVVETYKDIQEIKQLPPLERDEKGNIIYNSCVYEEIYVFDNFRFKEGHPIAQTKFWGMLTEVLAYGIEDFGEYVFIQIGIGSAGTTHYIKSGFEFPNHMLMECSGMEIRCTPGSNKPVNITDIFEKNALTLNDITDEVNIDNFYEKVEEKLDVTIYFSNYETIYMTGVGLAIREGKLYFSIFIPGYVEGDTKVHAYLRRYMIKDEYQIYFENAIEELKSINGN